MKRLILVIALLLTAGMALGHESENDTKHNAIHDSYVGKISHAHSHGNANGVARGDFHDHENAYQFGDESHNQKLSDYYISLHDVNNRDNFNERGELYFDHGLHTPDYIVTPPIQSDIQPQKRVRGAGVTVEVDPPPESPNAELRQSVARCPISWQRGSPEVIIGAIGYEYKPPYAITSIEIYTSQADTDLTDWRLQVKPWGSMRFTETALNASTNAFGFLRVVLPSPERMGLTGFDLMSFDVRLLTPDRKSVDIAVGCYPMHIDRHAFREAGRIERIIPQYELDAGISSLLGSKWNDYYRSSWKVIGVASAPSLRKPKLTTMWATLKKQ